MTMLFSKKFSFKRVGLSFATCCACSFWMLDVGRVVCSKLPQDSFLWLLSLPAKMEKNWSAAVSFHMQIGTMSWQFTLHCCR